MRGPDLAEPFDLLWDARTAMDEAWSGYSPRERPLIVYEPEESALLYAPPLPSKLEPPAPWTSYTDPTLPSPLAARLYVHAGASEGLDGAIRLRHPVGPYTATAVPTKDRPVDTVLFLLHEAFHAYQNEAFAAPPDAPDAYTDPSRLSAALLAQMEVERRVLADALASEDDTTMRRHIRRYLAVRGEREKTMARDLIRKERRLERHEGSAVYASVRATRQAVLSAGTRSRETDGDPVRAVNVTRITSEARPFRRPVSGQPLAEYVTNAHLERTLATYPGSIAERAFRWRSYGTGAAMGLLLDRLQGAGWHSLLEDGASFVGLLREATPEPPDGPARPTLARRTLNQYGYDSLKTAGRDRWQAGDLPPLAAFEDVPALLVSFPDGHTWRSSFRTSQLANRPRNRLLIRARHYSVATGTVSIEVRNRTVLETRGEERNRLRIMLSSPPNVPDTVSMGAAAPSFRWRAPGVEVSVDRPVEVARADSTLRVTILPHD
jgi:hypothetical protein